MNIKTSKENATQEELCHIQEKHLNWGWRILLVSLIYVVFIGAAPRLWQPTRVASGFMLIGVFIGLLGNTISMWALRKMEPFLTGGKNAHEGEYHGILIWDNLLDFSISLTVLSVALTLWFMPTTILRNHEYLFYRMDPALTLIIVPIIGRRGYKIFKKGMTHHH